MVISTSDQCRCVVLTSSACRAEGRERWKITRCSGRASLPIRVTLSRTYFALINNFVDFKVKCSFIYKQRVKLVVKFHWWCAFWFGFCFERRRKARNIYMKFDPSHVSVNHTQDRGWGCLVFEFPLLIGLTQQRDRQGDRREPIFVARFYFPLFCLFSTTRTLRELLLSLSPSNNPSFTFL